MANAQLLDIRYAGMVDLGTGSGTFEALVSNLGGEPVAAIFVVTDSNGSVGSSGVMTVGWTDGFAEGCTTIRDEDGVSTTNNARITRNDCCAFITEQDSNSTGGTITFNQWVTTSTAGGGDTSGVEFDLNDNIVNGFHCHVWLIAGTSVEASVQNGLLAPGDTDVTSPGFEPKAVFTAAGASAFNLWQNSAAMSLGIAVNKGTPSAPDQACAATAMQHNVATTNTRRSTHDALSGRLYIPNGAGILDGGSLTVKDFDADGFTVNKSGLGNAAVTSLALNWDDSIDFNLEVRQTPATVASQLETITTPGFETGILFFINALNSVTPNTIEDGSALTFGGCNGPNAYDPGDEGGGAGLRAQHGIGSTNVFSTSQDEHSLTSNDPRGNRVAEAHWNARDASGYVMEWDTMLPTTNNRYYIALQIENVPALIEPGGIASGEAFGTPTVELVDQVVDLFKNGIDSEEALGTPTLVAGAVTVEPGGIASAEAVGDPTLVAGAVTVEPGGIASAEAVGDPTLVAGAVVVEPGGIASAEAFGTPTVLVGVEEILPPGIDSAEAFGTPTLVAGVVVVEPGGIASAEAFGSPTIVAGAETIVVTGIASAEAVGTPTLVPTASVFPGAIGSQEQFGTPTLAAGALTVEPGGIASGEALGTPELLVGLLVVQPSAIASAEALGTPTLVPGALVILPPGISSEEALGDPTLVSGLATLLPPGIASAEALGDPTLVAGAADIQVPGIPSAEAFGTPLVTTVEVVLPAGIASAEGLGTPTILQGVLVVQPGGIASGEALGAPVLAPGAVTVEPGSIPSAEAFGTPTVTETIVVRPTSIPSEEAVGLPTLTPGEAFVVPSGIGSGEALGAPTLVGGDTIILVPGIGSMEALGTPFLVGGNIPVTLKKKIHDALIALAKSGTFVTATYDGETCILDQGTQVPPESVLANEVESAYSRDTRHGRKVRDDRTAWRWELRLRFHQEVITELFEEQFLANPISIPRESSDPSSRAAIVSLLNARFEHPPQQGASNGTEVVFSVNAQVCPA